MRGALGGASQGCTFDSRHPDVKAMARSCSEPEAGDSYFRLSPSQQLAMVKLGLMDALDHKKGIIETAAGTRLLSRLHFWIQRGGVLRWNSSWVWPREPGCPGYGHSRVSRGARWRRLSGEALTLVGVLV
jgi:hypothetical protein